ncbi:hypothetical protein [Saccharothrix texasensis]|uniref:Secreted protein n=1 Tax=Saccharothrix texasensis TaxID=103734 RepID=A0A3N1GXV6_9PSEU|nr:hypothetical protein [Saccharothrix texasensis]ROP35105.1 hypothetical protein EDD40_0322 [Saccharothrix texasensis]
MFRLIVTGVLLSAGLITFSSPASAAVVVPPGAAGSACSGYSYVTGHSDWYWQTCAWADNNEVYFTVNLGNAGDAAWSVDTIWVDYTRSGTSITCAGGVWSNFLVPAHSVKSTPTATCAIPRRSAEYVSVGQVWEASYHAELHSPVLQVQ